MSTVVVCPSSHPLGPDRDPRFYSSLDGSCDCPNRACVPSSVDDTALEPGGRTLPRRRHRRHLCRVQGKIRARGRGESKGVLTKHRHDGQLDACVWRWEFVLHRHFQVYCCVNWGLITHTMTSSSGWENERILHPLLLDSLAIILSNFLFPRSTIDWCCHLNWYKAERMPIKVKHFVRTLLTISD